MDDIQANSQTKKGGTVVPPSDFQSDTTKCADNKAFQESSSRPRGRSACVRTRVPVRRLYVLIACEESQAECKAFRELGHIAFSCDLQKCRKGGNPDWHIHGDVRPYLQGKTMFRTQSGKSRIVPRWDLIIAHPPCTYLCKVGSMHLYKNPDAWVRTINGKKYMNWDRVMHLKIARKFFFECLNAKAPYVAVENPIPMAIAELPKATCFADPSWFGVKYTKKTLYWLKNLPPVMAEVIYSNPRCYVTSSRGKYRSRTFPQLAKAIATQWASAILDDYSKKVR